MLPDKATAEPIERTEANARRAQPAAAASDLPLTVIEPSRGWIAINWKDLWQYRELLYFLTWRDVKVRYKQTVLGALWAILQPFMSMVVFTIFFGQMAGLSNFTGNIPYPIFVYTGLLPWTLFAQALARSSESVVSSANLVTKVYFPRLIIPAAATGACLVDFAFSFLVLVGMMIWYGIVPSLNILFLPAFILLTIVAALGFGALISALNVSYRDFRYVIPFAIQMWMFVTPVIYPVKVVPVRWHWVLALNPMTGVITGCRGSILDMGFSWKATVASVLVAFGVFLVGCAYFRRVERQFADII